MTSINLHFIVLRYERNLPKWSGVVSANRNEQIVSWMYSNVPHWFIFMSSSPTTSVIEGFFMRAITFHLGAGWNSPNLYCSFARARKDNLIYRRRIVCRKPSSKRKYWLSVASKCHIGLKIWRTLNVFESGQLWDVPYFQSAIFTCANQAVKTWH